MRRKRKKERKENNISLCFISFVAHPDIILRKYLSIVFFIANNTTELQRNKYVSTN